MPPIKRKDKDNVRNITTPSPYGSHSSMLVDLDKETQGHNIPKDKVICQDENGYYITFKNRMDWQTHVDLPALYVDLKI